MACSYHILVKDRLQAPNFTLKLVTTWLVIFSLFFHAAIASTAAQTQPFSLQNWSQTTRALQPRFSLSVRPGVIAQAQRNNHRDPNHSTNIGHAGRGLILLVALAGVELVRKQVREAQLSGRILTPQRYSQMAAEAAIKVADSGEVWLGIGSDLVLGAAATKPAKVLDLILKDRVARPLFINLIKSGIMSLIYFVGFQAAGQLWRDARLMLDPRDYEKSERIWSLGVKGMLDLLRTNRQSDDARIAKQMFINMSQILLFDNELRENWFYNTWRLSIATGRFVTLVSGIIAAMTIGTTIYPGAGTVAGFMFALTGAVAAAALPISFRDQITDRLQDARLAANRFQLQRSNWRLRNLVHAYDTKVFIWYYQTSSQEIRKGLRRLKELREAVATVLFERLYLNNTEIQKFQHEIAIATAGRNDSQAIGELNVQLREKFQRRNQTLRQLITLYDDQLSAIERIEVSADVPTDAKTQLEITKDHLRSLQSFMNVYSKALVRNDTMASAEVILQNFYLRSFKEIEITRLVNQQRLNLP